MITRHQFDSVVATLKLEGPEAAAACSISSQPKKINSCYIK